MQAQNLYFKIDGILVLVGAGRIDKKLLLRLHKNGATIIAADGGAKYCGKLNITPTAIIGDMDSLKTKSAWAEKTKLVELKEQETTDFEKCLYSTSAHLTIALGMSGNRLAHTLSAIDIIGRYACDRNIILIDEKDLAFGACGEFSLAIGAEQGLSIHPLCKIDFESSKGLKYPLDKITLAPNIKAGTSNKTNNYQFIITPKDNDKTPYLLILDRDKLDIIINKLISKG